MKFDNKKLTNKITGITEMITGDAAADPDKVHNRSLRSGRFNISGRVVIIALVAVLLVVAAVSAFVIFNEKDDVEGESESSGIELTASTVTGEPLKADILLCLSKSESEDIDFLALLSTDTEKGTVLIRKIDTRALAAVGSRTSTLENHFNSGGASALLSAIADSRIAEVDRYVFCTEEGLGYFFALLDPIELTIEKNIEFNYNGINLSFEEGTREFTADELVKYFCFLSENAEGNEATFEYIFKSIAYNFFDEENGERFVDLFSSSVNFFSTNVSAADVQSRYKVIGEFAKEGGIDRLRFETYTLNPINSVSETE